MIFKYQIMSYIPCFKISGNQIQHHWTTHKISNFLHKQLSINRSLINRITYKLENLHNKNELFYTDNGTMLYLEYTSKPLVQSFKVKSFIVIYE